ncbi:hypothetical protein LOK49_LG05G00336 [Camellia lanceoleosa]|uniref:Uncharacterized protein n=1 Tax=Camellia lanceoleosa TaxID=1840588 RepID=A0ACC0HPQ0_9ERIC|nr:hypothetical protein LOK49_LG05G00336 [Camellia lanceoleosa]
MALGVLGLEWDAGLFVDDDLLSIDFSVNQGILAEVDSLRTMSLISVWLFVVSQTLVDSVPHFNYRESLLAAVIKNISSVDDVVRF